jgi:hypothetical protein
MLSILLTQSQRASASYNQGKDLAITSCNCTLHLPFLTFALYYNTKAALREEVELD